MEGDVEIAGTHRCGVLCVTWEDWIRLLSAAARFTCSAVLVKMHGSLGVSRALNGSVKAHEGHA